MKKTLDDEDRRYLVRSYEMKALEALEDARDLLERRPGLSARMSYEAAYHFTAALFVSGGISLPRTHRGMNSELYRNFVDVGLFPKDVGPPVSASWKRTAARLSMTPLRGLNRRRRSRI